jgi:beta-glucanase (GH16 family)
LLITSAHAQEYFEDFLSSGQPRTSNGIVWDYQAELSPVEQWSELIPGDGFVYLTAEHEFLKRRPRPHGFWPFQTLSFGPFGAGHRISMRAKNTAIPGLAAMIFTYREQDRIDEIDLEITATDTESPRPHHRTGPDGGWTDLRMVTWIDADKRKPEPTTLVKQSAHGANGEPLSLQDDTFRVYTIEWDASEVRFSIDGVHQHTIEDAVPDRPARVIFGLRQMPWAGRADWKKPQTMTIDWVKVEPLGRD